MTRRRIPPGAAAALLLAAAAAGTVATRPRPGADIALPGSPLYGVAVTESVRSQAGAEAPEPEPAPCPDCGQVHPRAQAAGPGHSAPAAAVTSNYVYCANCRVYHPAPPRVGPAAPAR